MPAYLTHRAAGERVLDIISVPYRPAFYLGCQGPDMLFFHNYQPWRRDKTSFDLGVKMHHGDTRALLSNLLDYVRGYKGEDRGELVSYAAGFVTHYAVDKNAHPFVYKKVGKSETLHQAIEYMWDSFTAARQWGIEPQTYDIYSEVMYGEIGAGICEWYRNAARRLYDVGLNTQIIRKAQRQFAHAKQALAHIGPARRLLLKWIGAVAHFDTTCLLYPEVRDFSLFSEAEFSDMQKIVAKGVRQAQQMLPAALAAMNGDNSPLPAWFGDTDFAGGYEPGY